jgi:NADH:ubiquinone oxidoreductase subunit 6 (subunit J)
MPPQAAEAAPVAPIEERVKRGNSWAETKTDLKWATALLFVLILAISGYLWSNWAKMPLGEEDLNGMTDGIFDQAGSLLVPFEVLSVLLLAALIAGVVIAFRDPEVD